MRWHCVYAMDSLNTTRSGHLNIVKYLVERKQCNVYNQFGGSSRGGWTVVHSACAYDQLHIVRYFIEERSCNVNMTNDCGWTLLHTSSWGGSVKAVKYLIEEKNCIVGCTDNNGYTPLHWVCWSMDMDTDRKLEVMKYLLKLPECDPTQRDNLGMTALQFLSTCTDIGANKNLAIQLLLNHNATLPDESWETSVNQQPPEAYTKLFLMGFPGTGKSTLAKSIKTDVEDDVKSLAHQFKKVCDVSKNTSGIVPSDIESKRFGLMTIYDLAGHSEFYASHDFALRSILAGSPSSIILLVADISTKQDSLRKAILHWCNFASNLFDCQSNDKPFLFIIGSYADKVSVKDIESCKVIIESLTSRRLFSTFQLHSFIALDCRYPLSADMTQLRSHIADCCQSIKQQQEINIQQHCFLVGIISEFGHRDAFTIAELFTHAEQSSITSYFCKFICELEHNTIVKMCIKLNMRGNILFLRNQCSSIDSWIVLKKDVLLKRICGSIFAPDSFEDHKPLASDTGIVPAFKLAEEFPDVDTKLIISIMSHFQFCHEVTDPEILDQLSVVSSASTKYLFFPSLVTVTIPQGIWDPQSQFSHQSVWIMKCRNDEQFFISNFMHVTIHCLAFSFAMAPSSSSFAKLSIQRRCKVWKNGIFWRSLCGIDIIVEVDSKSIALYIRARKDCELDAVKLRSQLISRILTTKSEYCKEVEVNEFFVKPDCITFPLGNDDIFVNLLEIARSISTCKPFAFDVADMLVEIQALLHFEPFFDLGESVLCELFNQDAAVAITNEFLLKLAEKSHRKMNVFVKVLDISDYALAIALEGARPSNVDKFYRVLKYWQSRHPTYSELRATLAEYSIFVGRNPLDCHKLD
ncbi:uncharacterized protein LOC135345729 isoform X2 [Halichondria panicea]|uniref:uncharacterized protein LOC135345729 isoform X2 n=1 Tax=Halichondria panicea TaxID=6063 RepID=UPI00312BB123